MKRVLHHYCTNAAFHSIVSSKTVRLSALSLSNDTMEGKLFTDNIIELCKADKTIAELNGVIQTELKNVESVVHGAAFCLSQKGDLLSQWRGYAADGTGVSIGFSTQYLNSIAKESGGYYELCEVTYGKRKCHAVLKPVLHSLIEAMKETYKPYAEEMDMAEKNGDSIENGLKKWRGDWIRHLIDHAFSSMYSLKTEAFLEEAEVRMITCSPPSFKHFKFAPKADRLVPYCEMEIQNEKTNPISEVILGPKNATPINVIEAFLDSHGFKDVKVKRSSATYR
jgi:hypothetical protein